MLTRFVLLLLQQQIHIEGLYLDTKHLLILFIRLEIEVHAFVFRHIPTVKKREESNLELQTPALIHI